MEIIDLIKGLHRSAMISVFRFFSTNHLTKEGETQSGFSLYAAIFIAGC